MSSAKSQKDKILKLSTKDKKLARLFNYDGMSDKDSLFLNYVYEEKQQLNFRYAIVLSGFTALTVRHFMFRTSSGMTGNVVFFGLLILGNFYWSSIINQRYVTLTQPYFEKYRIK